MGRTSDKRPTADEALKILFDGNQRFVKGKLEHPNHCEESRQSVASGQEPTIADIAKDEKVNIIPAYYDLSTDKVSLL